MLGIYVRKNREVFSTHIYYYRRWAGWRIDIHTRTLLRLSWLPPTLSFKWRLAKVKVMPGGWQGYGKSWCSTVTLNH